VVVTISAFKRQVGRHKSEIGGVGGRLAALTLRGRRWRFVTAGAPVLVTALLVVGGKPRDGLVAIVSALGFGLVIGSLVNAPWLLFAATAARARSALAITTGWLVVQATVAAVAWSLSTPVRPPAGDWLGPCLAAGFIGLVTIGIVFDSRWVGAAQRWVAGGVAALVMAGCVVGGSPPVVSFLAAVGEPVFEARVSDAYFLPGPDGLAVRDFEPSCGYTRLPCDVGYEIWDPANADRADTMARMAAHLRERGFAIYGDGRACVDLRGFFDWGRSCVALHLGDRPGAVVVIVSVEPVGVL
jgi:hypothetical protein